MSKTLTALLLLLLCWSAAWSNTFTVTTNADGGAGSLREAITLANANGTASVDSIVFNIADLSITGRTISVLTELPYLTSNIVIDGTTQPGGKIGVTDAAIRITQAAGKSLQHVFAIVDAQDVGIYGIHFYQIGGGLYGSCAIRIRNAFRVDVGAPGHGNYFTKISGTALANPRGIFQGVGLSSDISFRSNIVNLTENGSAINDCCTNGINLSNVKNLQIGGPTPAEGNIFNGGYSYSLYIETDTTASLDMGYLRIMNNGFGCDFTRTQRLFFSGVYIRNYGSGMDITRITISDNSYDFTPQGSSSGGVTSIPLHPFMIIENKKGFLEIKGNKISQLSPANSFFYGDLTFAFSIYNCGDGIIGGPDPKDVNYIVGCWTNGVALNNNGNITITENSFWCNSKGIAAASTLVTIPKTNITTLTDYDVAGTTLPNSKVEVFLNKANCMDCQNGKTYLGTVTADASGKWSFTSPVLLDGPVTATGTSPGGATGEFAHPEYQLVQYDNRFPTCKGNNGYIHGVRYVSGTRYYWLRSTISGTTDTLFTEDVDNAAPGWYKFVVEQGPYCSTNYQVSLLDNSPKISSQYKTIVQPSCGKNNGGISNIYLSGSYNKVYWEDANGTIMGTRNELQNAGPGDYKLVVLDTVYGCGDSTAFFTLTNQQGPSLNTNTVTISPATCNGANGSITGITANNATGSPSVLWVDSLNRFVAYGYDLKNVRAGKYRLKFKDAGGCDTLFTNYFVITGVGAISIDSSGKSVKASNCSGPTGSISGIKITGADQYQWKDVVGNNTVATNVDVFNLAAGKYQLTASNSYGCSVTLPTLVVSSTAFTTIGVTGVSFLPDICSQGNGHIKIKSFNNDSNLYNFRWVDSATQQIVGTGTELSNVRAGTYYLYAKDTNQCEKMIYTHLVVGTPFPVINMASLQVKDDHCELKQGSISSIQVTGLYGPSTYTWYDGANGVVGNTVDLKNLSAGSYVLKVTDAGVCTVQSPPIVVNNVADVLPPPVYNDLLIPRYSDAVLSPKIAATGSYSLMGAGGASQQSSNGTFTIKNVSSDTSVNIVRTYGTCTSAATSVNIKVVDKSYFTIPTAFSPNGDGKNDRLHVRVIGYIELSYFRIYNRWGQLVFETSRLNDGWNGLCNGQLQNSGAYVWMAEGKDIKGRVVSERGSFVLIR